MRTITETVFGRRTKRKPGGQIMCNFREALKNSKYFLTYKEVLPNDSLIFNYNEKTFQRGNELSKYGFCDSQSTTPWSSGKDKNTTILFIISVLLFYKSMIITFNL